MDGTARRGCKAFFWGSGFTEFPWENITLPQLRTPQNTQLLQIQDSGDFHANISDFKRHWFQTNFESHSKNGRRYQHTADIRSLSSSLDCLGNLLYPCHYFI